MQNTFFIRITSTEPQQWLCTRDKLDTDFGRARGFASRDEAENRARKALEEFQWTIITWTEL